MPGEESWVAALGKWALPHLWRLRSVFQRDKARPLRFVAQPRKSRWGVGKRNGKDAMHVRAEWSVANTGDADISLVRAYDRKSKTETGVSVLARGRRIWGSFPIPANDHTEIEVSFFICPMIRKEGDDYQCKVFLFDHLGNRYKEKIVVRGTIRTPREKKSPDTTEAVHLIQDGVERHVVSVLKDECTRYRDCGRRTGGLGSIETKHKERTGTGVGNDSRTPGRATNQSIVEDPQPWAVTSDNGLALFHYFESLSGEDRQRFIAAIANRMDRTTEYAPVGYFCLFVLFRVHALDLALDTAKTELRGDGAHGFSDLLRLLDGLLRFEHVSFDEEDLDLIEAFVRDLDEEEFRILERLAAVRAYRVRKGI